MKLLEFSPITLSYKIDEELNYRIRQLDNDLSLLRNLSFLTFLIEVSYCIKDLFWSTNVPAIVLNFRLYYLTPLMLIVFLVTYSRWVKKHPNNMYILSIWLLISLIIGQYFMTAMNQNPDSSFAKTLPLIFFSTYLFSGIKFKHTLYVTPLLIAVYLIVIIKFEDIPNSVKINDSILVAMNIVLAVFFKYILEKNRRNSYKDQLIIEQNEERLEKNLVNEQMLSALRKDLIALLAHDIRAPMNNLKGIIKLLDSRTISSEKGEELLGQVGERIEVISKGVNDLLVWVRSKESGLKVVVTEFRAADFINEILDIGKVQIEQKHISIKTRIDKSLKISTDKGAVQTVVRNLLSNAIKFSKDGSVIEINIEAQNDLLNFEIIDFGVGMDEEAINKVSESFHTTEGTNNESGIGLGLQICFALLEKLGSKLNINSEIGKGTKMSFSLRHNIS